MATLTQVMEKMRAKGYEQEFKMSDHGRMQLPGSKKVYNAEELKIVRTFRFEGESDPADSSVLYLLETRDGEKGFLLDAYGAYSGHAESGFDEFLKKIPVEDRDDQF
ncbi:hypothetical protein GCM10009415_13190 [Chitinophaga japonensis]